MQKKFLTPLLTFLLLSYSAVSQAGLLIEPVLGYNFTSKASTVEKNYNAGDGVGYGGRLGFASGDGFQLGFDYLKSEINMSSGDFNKDIYEEDLGGFVGYKFKRLFKVYGTYIFSASGNTKINDRAESLDNGTGFKFGIGCTIIPLLDINLDYRKVGFNKDIAVDSMMLSVSVPINLFD
jgi:hypothetical protein